MKRQIGRSFAVGVMMLGLSAAPAVGFAARAHAQALNPSRIEQLTGLKGQLNQSEGVFKVTYPRKDLKVESLSVKITPDLGLTAWTSFESVGNQVMAMGDIVLTENQVNAVLSAALDNGLEVTALHNHFFWEKPRIFFMHISGMGDEDEVATAVGKVFATLKSTANAGDPASAPIDPGKTTLNPKKVEQILGHSGDLKNGVYKVTIGRKTSMHGHEAGNTMGVNTWAAFAGSDDKAVVDGDFAMTETELQPVLKALRKANINIVAIHNHMVGENPRIMFLHFWGIGSAADLAKGVRAALDQQDLR